MSRTCTQSLFDAANAIGGKAEAGVADLFLRAGWMVQWRPCGARRDLALINPPRHELLEVKNEERYSASGNICVELWQGDPRRPSGLSISESTWYVHWFGAQCVAYRTQQMRLWIEGNPEEAGRVRQFGDNCNAGLLIPRAKLVDLWFVYDGNTSGLPECLMTR